MTDDYYLAAEMRGRRPDMEDAHCVNDLEHPSMFAVFDGHGGEECARFCVQNLLSCLAGHEDLGRDPCKALDEAFVSVDAQYVSLAKQLELEDGSTGTVLYIDVQDEPKYYLACAGDSRAIIVKADGSARALVEDHNPARDDERARVKRDGGEVLYDVDNQIYRVASKNGGGLAVTRSFGDHNFKPFVTAKPEIAQGVIQQDDAYICLASDGLWGDLENHEVGVAIIKRGPKAGVEYVMEEAFARGSDDNITCMVIDLQRAVKHLREAAKKRPTNSRSSMNHRSRRVSPATRVTSADEGAGPNQDSDGFDKPTSDALILKVARKISAVAVPPSLKLTRDVDDVEIPGIHTVFSNDLILWRDPVLSFLWFTIITSMFILNVRYEIPYVTLVSMGWLWRLVGMFCTARIFRLLQRFKILKPEFSVEKFIVDNQLISANTTEYFVDAIVGLITSLVENFNDIVIKGSTTKVLVALRTLTYFYTPVPMAVLAWIAFTLIYIVPATYARNKIRIDNFVKDVTTKATKAIKPRFELIKTRVEKIFGVKTLSHTQSFFSNSSPLPLANKKQPNASNTGDAGAGAARVSGTGRVVYSEDHAEKIGRLKIGFELSEPL